MDQSSVRDLFSRHGLRTTVQREMIYAALSDTKCHPTAEELFTTVRQTQPGISLATIYNALDAFVKAGLCRRMAMPHTDASPAAAYRFDADMSDHAHLVTLDGRVRDLPDDLSREILSHLPPELMSAIESRTGVRVGRMSVEFIQDRPETP